MTHDADDQMASHLAFWFKLHDQLPEFQGSRENMITLEVHLGRFFTALRSEVPEAFENLETTVFYSCENWERRSYPEKTASMKAALRWLDRWQINPTCNFSLVLLFSRIDSTCYHWNKYPEMRLELRPNDGYPLKTVFGTPRKMAPPEHLPSESLDDFRLRAQRYYANANYLYKKKTGQKTSFAEGMLAWAESTQDAPKRTPEHYRWAAYWQCHPKGKKEAGYRFKKISERQVGRTLKECGLSGQKSPIFDI